MITGPASQDDPLNGGTVDAPFAELLPWSAFALRLTRAQIPQLPALLAAVPAHKHAAMLRAGACVWPRLFWMPSAETRMNAPSLASSAVGILPERCDQRCADEIRRLEPHDAFSTLLWLLGHRLKLRRQAAERAAGRKRAISGAGAADDLAVEEGFAAEAAARVEASWEAGPRHLRSAPWRTPAASCEVALELDSHP